MRSEQPSRRRTLAPTLGAVVGIVAGVSAATWSPAVAGKTSSEPPAVLDATHLPPLLTAGEPLDLAYDVHCAASDDETADNACAVRGSVFVRSIGDRSFSELPLASRSVDGLRQLAAVVPDTFVSKGRGVEYYALVEAPDIGKRMLVPAGGPAAPHVSRPLGDAVAIDLGRHDFGVERRAGARVASAAWGERGGQAGLERGRNLTPIGASSFDVDAEGNVLLLDQVHHRLLRWRKGEAPDQLPVSVDGTLADMAVADDGSFYVLESTAPPGRNPLVKRFDEGGRELEAIESAERTPSQIRIDERGPVVLGRPSHHWAPVVVDGVPASADKQLARGRAGRRLDGGREVVVFRHTDEVRVAIVAGRNVIRSWRVRSSTPLAEVQLAEPWGQRMVLVVHVYETGADEFVVLVLGRDGLVDRFALGSADWAESAPLGRFRFVGKSLYRLGSTPSGVFIDRFDLEVS